MNERLFALQHEGPLGCPKPRCHYIYTIDEIQSNDMEDYIQNHKYVDSPLVVYQLKSKIWSIDEIVNAPEIVGWTPRFFLDDNGFFEIAKINIFKLFGTPQKPNQQIGKHDLNKKKSELEAIFERLDYKHQELIIYRSKRYGLCNWDNLGVFSIGCYHNSKETMRDQIIQDCITRYKKRSEIKNKCKL